MEKTKRIGGARKGAGAKPYAEQNKARELVGLGVDVCIKALKREGEFKDLETSVYLDLAARVAIKAIPNVVEGNLTETKYQEIIHRLEGFTTDDLRCLIESSRTRALQA